MNKLNSYKPSSLFPQFFGIWANIAFSSLIYGSPMLLFEKWREINEIKGKNQIKQDDNILQIKEE